MVPDSVLDQFGAALCAQHFHHPVFVIRNRPGRHIQDVAHFLHHLSFGQQLQDFALPGRFSMNGGAVGGKA